MKKNIIILIILLVLLLISIVQAIQLNEIKSKIRESGMTIASASSSSSSSGISVPKNLKSLPKMVGGC
jgi:type II secretory pathway pseudopilin PulG